MSDLSVISFPRVVAELSNPTPAQNKNEGYVEGTIWVNKTTGRIFTLVDRDIGKWVIMLSSDALAGGITFGDGSDQDGHFDLGNGNFTVDANNFVLDENGTPEFSGNVITLNKNYTSGTNPPSAELRIIRGDFDDSLLKWDEDLNTWLSGVPNPNPSLNRLLPIVNTVTFSRDPLPSDNWDEGFFVGEQWINMATGKTFVCTECPPGVPAVWREVLTDAAPTTNQVQTSDSFIVYNSTTRAYSEIGWNDFIQFIIAAVGGVGPSTIGYGWVSDASDDISPSNEDPIQNGLFESDGNNDLMPLVSPSSDPDVFFELDGNDDLTLQVVT